MRDPVYHLIFEGLSDWEAALALAEINWSDGYTTAAVGPTADPVTTAAARGSVAAGVLSVAPGRAVGDIQSLSDLLESDVGAP